METVIIQQCIQGLGFIYIYMAGSKFAANGSEVWVEVWHVNWDTRVPNRE